MSIAVGAVHVDVVPSTRDFVSTMRRDLLGEVDAIGREVGERIGKEASQAAATEITHGVEDGVDNADTARTAGRKGKESGGAFAREFKAELRTALESLPQVDLEANSTPVLVEINRIREELSTLANKNIGINISAEDAKLEAERIKMALATLRDQSVTVDVKYDIDKATAALGQLERKIAQDVGGSFDKTLRDSLTGAIKSLPKIELNADAAPAERALAGIRDELQTFSDFANVDLNINAESAFADVERISTALRALINDENVDIKVRIDAAVALSNLGAIEAAKKRVEGDVEIRVEVAGSFAETLKSSVESALRALPNNVIEIDANTDPADAALAVLRGELEAFGNLKIGVHIEAAEAIAQAAELQASFQALADDESLKMDVRLNAAGAIAGLEAIAAKARSLNNDVVDVEREVGMFARQMRADLEAALRNLPDIQIDINSSAAEARLQALREEIATFHDLNIGVDLTSAEAEAGIARVMAELQALADTTPQVEIRTNALAAIADLEKVRARAAQDIKVAVQIDTANEGAFTAKLRALLASVQQTLPKIDVDANTTPAELKVNGLRGVLEGLHANIGVDLDATATMAQLKIVEAELQKIDLKTVNVQVKADVGKALADIAAFRTALEGAAESGSAGMNRMQLIMVAVAALFPLAAGAVLGLTAAISLAATPIAAVVVGLNGIKAAIQPLTDEFRRLQDTVSATFEAGLAPAVQNVTKLFPVLEQGLQGTARALSQVAIDVTGVVTSSANLHTIQDSFNQINIVVQALSPAISIFAQNLITLTNIGASGLALFAGQMQQVAADFGDMINRLAASGTAKAAIDALFSVLSSIIGLIGPLTELGAVLLAAFGPVLAAAINGIGMVIQILASALDSLPAPIDAVLAGGAALGLIMLALGSGFSTLGTQIKSGAMTAFTGLRVAMIDIGATFSSISGRVVAAGAEITGLGLASRLAAPGIALVGTALKGIFTLLGGWPGVIITAITVGLSLLGLAQQGAAAGASEHAAAVQELTSALNQSGGAITSTIIGMTTTKIEAAGLGDSIKTLGLNLSDTSAAVANGGPQYDRLKGSLEALVTGIDNVSISGAELTKGQEDQRAAAQALLDKLPELRGQFVDAGAAAKRMADELSAAGVSLVGGIANAQALEKAFTALGQASTTTKDKVKELKAALDALNGGTITAEQAAATLNAAIRDIGKAFTDAATEAKNTHTSLITVSGGINTTTAAGGKLFDATMAIRDGMIGAAATAFDAAGGLTNVQGASAAAAEKVQSARDAFLAAAKAAGINATDAKNLADHYGLIPKLVTTLLEAKNIPLVQQQLSDLGAIINNQIPGTKSVTVTALSDEALKTLDSLGIKVERLPDGRFQVFIDDMTQPGIQSALTWMDQQHGRVPVGADVAKVQSDVDAAVEALRSRQAKLPVTATMERNEIDDQISALQSKLVKVPVGGNTTPLQSDVAAQIAALEAKKATLPIAGSFERKEIDNQIADLQTKLVKVPVAAETSKLQSDVAAEIAALQAKKATLPIAGSFERKEIDNQIADLQSKLVKVPVTTDNSLVPPGAAAAAGTVTSTPAPLKITPDTSAVPPAAAAAAGQVTATPAPMPFKPDASAVAPAAQAAAGQVATVPAILTIAPGGMDGVNAAIAGLRNAVTAPAVMPVSSVDAGAGGMIGGIRAIASATVTMPVGAVDAGASGTIGGIRAVASATATMPVGAVDAGASGTIGGLRAVASATATMPIAAVDNMARGTLQNMVNAVAGTTGTMQINAVSAGADGILRAMVATVTGTTATMKIDADLGLATNKVNMLVNNVNRTTATIIVDANTAAAAHKIDLLKQPTGSIHTVTIVTQGQMPNAMGNILPAGFSLFASGGFDGKRLTPMAANYADIVQPNTFRVIGDRAQDAEAYIPLNNSARSQSILRTAAGQMGYGLVPLAGAGQMSTQPMGSFTPAGTASSAPAAGFDTKNVESRLDQMIALLADAPRSSPSIHVEDRSGNPVETARATQLALRLAR